MEHFGHAAAPKTSRLGHVRCLGEVDTYLQQRWTHHARARREKLVDGDVHRSRQRCWAVQTRIFGENFIEPSYDQRAGKLANLRHKVDRAVSEMGKDVIVSEVFGLVNKGFSYSTRRVGADHLEQIYGTTFPDNLDLRRFQVGPHVKRASDPPDCVVQLQR